MEKTFYDIFPDMMKPIKFHNYGRRKFKPLRAIRGRRIRLKPKG